FRSWRRRRNAPICRRASRPISACRRRPAVWYCSKAGYATRCRPVSPPGRGSRSASTTRGRTRLDLGGGRAILCCLQTIKPEDFPAMAALFEPLQLRSVTLPNRIVLSPMCQYSAIDGVPNNWHRVHLGRYATAGLGLLIAEATHVNAQARITPGCLGLYNAVHEAAFAEIVADAKQFGPAPVGVQLAHAGRK